MMYLGDYPEDATVYLMFNTFSSDDPTASVTITDLVNTDVHIHKDDGLTQRNNAAGITVSTDFDSITGSHMIKIDTSDDTVVGFWVAAHDYFVRIEGTTVDGGTINAVVAHFSIENRFMRGTDSAALAATALTNATWTDAKAGYLTAAVATATALATAQTDLDTLTGSDGVTLATSQANYAPATTAALSTMQGNVTDILADTNELQGDWTNTGRLDTILDAILTDTGTTIPGTITTMQGNVTSILEDTGTTIPGTITTMQGNVTSILEDTSTTLPATLAGLNDITVADIIAGVADGSYDLQEMMRLIFSACCLKVSGGGTTTISFRDSGDAKDRLVTTVDASGNRTAVTLDGS